METHSSKTAVDRPHPGRWFPFAGLSAALVLALAALPGCGPSGPKAPAGLYAAPAGETILAADPGLPDSLPRARAVDTFYRLSNLRFGQNRFGRPMLQVDYEKTRVGDQNGITLQLRAGDGRRQSVMIIGPMHQTQGTLEVDSPYHRFPMNQPPKDLEAYLTHSDHRYNQPRTPEFKVSNSAVIGHLNHLTLPRNWTAEEIAAWTSPPPNFTNPNAHQDAGRDTDLAGTPDPGTIARRLVEPGGRLLGLEYRLAEWDKERCVGYLVPIFKRTQPTTMPDRVVAKEGYVVGAVKVNTHKFVDALQLVFMRQGADGALDPKDTYTSQWIGYHEGGTETTLGGGGTPIIGISCRQGAILNALALVEEAPAAK